MTATALMEFELETELPEPEAERVLRWRFDALRRAGFESQDALRLAHKKGLDLHQAVGLLAHGCPEDTALLILL